MVKQSTIQFSASSQQQVGKYGARPLSHKNRRYTVVCGVQGTAEKWTDDVIALLSMRRQNLVILALSQFVNQEQFLHIICSA